MSPSTNQPANQSLQRIKACAAFAICLAVSISLLPGPAAAGTMVVVPDESTDQPDPGIAEPREPSGPEIPPSSINPEAKTPRDRDKRTGSLALAKQRASQACAFAEAMEEEENRMLAVVQPLDRGSAAEWLSSFLSTGPWHCPLQKQRQWIEAILDGMEKNRLPICKETVGLVACIISIESGFRADPLAVDPSRGEDMRRLLDRADKQLFEKHGAIMHIPPVPQLYAAYKERYFPQLLACRTEGQVELVARRIAAELKRDAGKLPQFVGKVVEKELDKLFNLVRTKGSMQLNFPRARQVMKERGEQFTDQELTDYMYTVPGGVDCGIAALRPMFVQYAACYATPGELSWLFFVGMDYHYGPFSSRNMMEQIRIRDLSGLPLTLDGDFLHYDEQGLPLNHESDTLHAAAAIFPSLSRWEILSAFLMEKDQQYAYTELHGRIVAAHLERFGETPFAAIGDLVVGKDAQLKHGITWKTHAYLNKLRRYLNSVPWDQ
ncbi:MAG: DUF1615 family protein [Desulfomonile tiedjei]|nr:DUF1615 family protein [Desulfomonile tiedjei]